MLITLFFDHGLRCGELAVLRVDQVHLEEGTICFDRPKVEKNDQTHLLSPHARQALARYLQIDRPEGKLLWGSRKGGRSPEA